MADSASTPSSTSSTRPTTTSSISSGTTAISTIVSSGTPASSLPSTSTRPTTTSSISSSTTAISTIVSSGTPTSSLPSTSSRRPSSSSSMSSPTTSTSSTSPSSTPTTTSITSTSTTSTTTSTTTTSSTTSTITTSTSSSTTSSTPSSTSSSTTTSTTATSTTTTSTTTTFLPSTSTSSSTSFATQPTQTSTTLPPIVYSSTTNPPTTTFESIHFVTTTDHQGELTTTAPSIITTVLTSTASNGVVTITQVGINQTLSPNNSTSGKLAFFRNTGAVAGVFVLVGLTAASVLLWILFALRRRRRTQRLEHDTAVSATLAAAGFHRTPLDDDDDQPGGSRSRSRFGSPDIEMNQRTSAMGTSSSAPSAGRASAYIDAIHPDEGDPFNPYTDYRTIPGPSSPPVAFYNGPYRDRTDSGSAGDHVIAHSATHSAGSYEPLLASFRQSARPSSPVLPSDPSTSRPRHSQKLSDYSQPLIVLTSDAESSLPADKHVTINSSSRYSSESIADDRLDPGLRIKLNVEADRASVRDLRDDEDYSRPVLGIRNMPDAASQLSRES